jgi:hypothetical protein
MACARAADPSGPSRSISLVLHWPGVGHFATTTMTVVVAIVGTVVAVAMVEQCWRAQLCQVPNLDFYGIENLFLLSIGFFRTRTQLR